MSRSKLRATTLLLTLGAAAFLIVGDGNGPEAAIPPDVLLMRCMPQAQPTFGYQVVALSMTPELDVDIEASNVNGEGEDCAVAISRILAVVNRNRLAMHVTDNALVVTVID